MKKTLIAGASVMALAGAVMPMAGAFADDDRSVTDTINVTVDASCTFNAGGADVEYSANGTNGQSVNPVNNSSNEHSFTVFCNNNSGYKVSATASALTKSDVTDNFAYAATLPSGTAGAWNAAISQAQGGSLTIEQLPSGGAATDIVTLGEASAAAGETFKATYTAYIGTETPAGTYTGTIGYTLAPNA